MFCDSVQLVAGILCARAVWLTSQSKTYSMTPGGSACLLQRCPPGTYSGDGFTSCSSCPAGYRCLSSSATRLVVPCRPGEYSAEASRPTISRKGLQIAVHAWQAARRRSGLHITLVFRAGYFGVPTMPTEFRLSDTTGKSALRETNTVRSTRPAAVQALPQR